VRDAGDSVPQRVGPEVVDDGITGFIVDNEEQAVGVVKRLHELDRARIRQVFDEYFTARRMPRITSTSIASLSRNTNPCEEWFKPDAKPLASFR